MVFPVLNDSRTHKSAQSVGLNPKPGITRWRVRSGPSLEKTSGELLPKISKCPITYNTPHIAKVRSSDEGGLLSLVGWQERVYYQ